MLKIFEEYNNTTNILQHFQYYDERQELYDKSRKLNDERVDKQIQLLRPFKIELILIY